MRPDKDELRRKAISVLRARQPVELDGEDHWPWLYIAGRLLPILEHEEAATKRGDRVELAAEPPQVLPDGGTSQKEAHKLVREQCGGTRSDKDELRRKAISVFRALLRLPVEIDGEDRWPWFYIAGRLLPILEREERGTKGRGDRVEGAGELVQIFVEGGMSPRDARKMVQERTGHRLKYASVAAAHRQFLKAGQPSIMYQQWREHLAALKPCPSRDG